MLQGMRALKRGLGVTALVLGLAQATSVIAVPIVPDFMRQPLAGTRTDLPSATGTYGDVVKALDKGDFPTAVRLASNHVTRAPRDAQAHLLFVLANVGAGNFTAIRTHIAELQRTAPNLVASLRTTLANYYLSQRRYQRAAMEVAEIPSSLRTPEVQLLRANVAASLGDVKGGMALLKPLAEDPQSTQHNAALLNLSRLSLAQGNPADALQYGRRLLARSPDDLVALAMIASASLQTQDYKGAREASQRILRKDPKSELAKFVLGLAEFLGGDYRNAEVSFAAASGSDGETGSLLAALAAGKKPAALKAAPADGLQALAIAAQRAAAADPGYRTSLAGAVSIFPDFGRPQFDYGKYAGLKDPALRTLATAAFLQRHVGGAPTQSYLAKATSAKSDPFLDILRARIASGDRHPELARPILEKAAQQFPELASIAIDRADLELQAGNSDRAIALYREAIARFADMPQLRIRLGDMLNSIGKRKEAIAEYERAQVAFPKDTYVMNQLAATLTLLGDRSSGERALKLIDTAISAAPPKDKDFLEDTRAGALFVAGRKADALASYRALEKKGYALGPDSLSRYGRLLLEQKQNAAGLRALERAVDAGPRYTGWEADRATVTKL